MPKGHYLSYDKTTSIDVRKYTTEQRSKIIGKLSKYQNLLEFSKSQLNLINEDERRILDFCHVYRNSVYHQGRIEINKVDLILLFYILLIKKKFNSWGIIRGIGILFKNGKVPIEYSYLRFGKRTNQKKYLLDQEKYYEDALYDIVYNKKQKTLFDPQKNT